MGRLKSVKTKHGLAQKRKEATSKGCSKKNLKIEKRKSVPLKSKNNSTGAKNTVTITTTTDVTFSSRKSNIKKLEIEILASSPLVEESAEKSFNVTSRDMLEQIMFRLPYVTSPLIGTPQQVQKELDSLVKKMQLQPNDDSIFNKIHLYMHGYLINVVLKKFPFIRGLQTVDIYQETLIALRFKAIPNFKLNKGMSFLNFAKMCIRRHLITLLNTSKNRKKDQSINRAISLDSSPLGNFESDEDGRNTYANIISDGKMAVDKELECSEAYEVTRDTLLNALSEFEQVVLNEYLSSSSYREISKNISRKVDKRHNTKSIDNALLRIRKKAMQLKKYSRFDDLPIFLPKNQ